MHLIYIYFFVWFLFFQHNFQKVFVKHVCECLRVYFRSCVSQNVLCDFLYRWKDNFSGFAHTMSVFWYKKFEIYSLAVFFGEKKINIYFQSSSFIVGLICRPAILSIPYLLFVFYIPFLPAQNHTTFYRHGRIFFKCVIFATFTIVLSQTCLHIVLFARNLKPLVSIGDGSGWGQFLQNIGFAELYKPE